MNLTRVHWLLLSLLKKLIARLLYETVKYLGISWIIQAGQPNLASLEYRCVQRNLKPFDGLIRVWSAASFSNEIHHESNQNDTHNHTAKDGKNHKPVN